jgi:hypothetical protein
LPRGVFLCAWWWWRLRLLFFFSMFSPAAAVSPTLNDNVRDLYTSVLNAARRAYVLQEEIEAFQRTIADLSMAPPDALARQHEAANEYVRVSAEIDEMLPRLERETIRRTMLKHTPHPESIAELEVATASVDAPYAVEAHMGARAPVPVDMRRIARESSLCQKCGTAPAEIALVSGSTDTTQCALGVNCLCDCAAIDVFPACIACWTEHTVETLRRMIRFSLSTCKDPTGVPPPWRECEVQCMFCGQMTCAFRACKIVDQATVFTPQTDLVTTPPPHDVYGFDALSLGSDDLLSFLPAVSNTEPLYQPPPQPAPTGLLNKPATFSTILEGVASLFAEVSQNNEASEVTVEKVVGNIRSLAPNVLQPEVEMPTVLPGSGKPSPPTEVVVEKTKETVARGSRIRHCSVCGQPGHNKTGHAKIVAAARRMLEQGDFTAQ